MKRLSRGYVLLFLVLLANGAAFADYAAGQQAFEAKQYQRALQLWQTAAAGGDVEAIYALGKMHGEGLGVLQDLVEAHALFNVAAARGHQQALVARQLVEERMSPEEQGAARTLAKEYFARFSGTGSTAPAATSKADAPAAGAKLLLIAGDIPLYTAGHTYESDAELVALHRQWLNKNVEILKSILGDSSRWVLKKASGSPNTVEAKALCRRHDANAVLINRLVGSGPNANWQRNMRLWLFRCSSGEVQSKTYQQKASEDGWELDKIERNIAAFIGRTKLFE